MNFDATQLAIRERGFGEILDLALRVARSHAGPLLLAWLVGAAPFALLNGWLLSGLLADSIWDNRPLYVYWQFWLVAVEAPLATGFMTLYLGQVTFAGRGDAGRIARDYWRSLPQMLLSQGLFRVLAAAIVVPLLLPYVSWPYLSELILLERNPMFAGKAQNGVKRLTTRSRSKNLHRSTGGDLFTRWVVSTAVGALLIGVLVGGVQTIADQLFGYQVTPLQNLRYTFPIALWMVFGYFAVVRFLAYLDLRIRREGWEVELTMRAEAARLARLA
ncbi:MAG: hypothetical protein AAGB00_08395 [Planctomycetota bacterium]